MERIKNVRRKSVNESRRKCVTVWHSEHTMSRCQGPSVLISADQFYELNIWWGFNHNELATLIDILDTPDAGISNSSEFLFQLIFANINEIFCLLNTSALFLNISTCTWSKICSTFLKCQFIVNLKIWIKNIKLNSK